MGGGLFRVRMVEFRRVDRKSPNITFNCFVIILFIKVNEY